MNDGIEDIAPSATSTEDKTFPAFEVINQTVALDAVVAQAESMRSFFLANTAQNTRAIPMVSAKLPLDEDREVFRVDPSGESHRSSTEASELEDGSCDPAFVPSDGVPIADASTVVGSFTSDGITYAVEPGGESVAVVAVGYAKLPQQFIEKQVLVIPGAASPDGVDAYSVTRLAASAFASLTKESANPDFTGAKALFSDEELLAEAGIDKAEAAPFLSDEEKMVDVDGDGKDDVVANPLRGCAGILALSIPAAVTSIEEDAFAGADTLQYLVVSEENQTYATYDGALYSADLTALRRVPEGRVGAVRIAPTMTDVDPEAFSQCPSVDLLVVDKASEAFEVLDGGVLLEGRDDRVRFVDSEAACEQGETRILDELAHRAFFSGSFSAPTVGASDRDGAALDADLDGSDEAFGSDRAAAGLMPHLDVRSSSRATATLGFAGSSSGSYLNTDISVFSGFRWKFVGGAGIGVDISHLREHCTDASCILHRSISSWETGTPSHFSGLQSFTKNSGTLFWCSEGYLCLSYEGGTTTAGNGQSVSGWFTLVLAPVTSGTYVSSVTINGASYRFGDKLPNAGTIKSISVTSTTAQPGKSVTVHWNSNGGGSVADWTIPSGGSLASNTAGQTALPAPKRTGWVFDGWYKSNSSFTAANKLPIALSSTTLTADVTYYARWQIAFVWIDPTMGTTSFSYKYSPGDFATSVGYGSVWETAPTYTRGVPAGWTFYRWSRSSTASSSDVASGGKAYAYNQNGGNQYYPRWEAPIKTNLNYPGHDTATSLTTLYGSGKSPVGSCTVPAVSRAGYTFDGWNVDYVSASLADDNSKYKGPTITLKGAAVLLAQWTANTYTVSFDPNGGTGGQAGRVTATYDAAMPAISTTAPVRVGYTFQGWYDTAASSGGTQYYAADGSSVRTWNKTSDATLYARWSLNSYSVTYQDGAGNALSGWATEDGSTLPSSFNEATTPDARTLPSMVKRGYTWKGWLYEGSPVTSIPDVSKSITLVADFSADPYTIEVDLDGGSQSGWHEGAFEGLTYDDPVLVLPANASNLKKPGYAFSHFVAYRPGGTEPAVVYERGSGGEHSIATTKLAPGGSYRVLNLGSDEDIYDIASIKAVWTTRIAVEVPVEARLGILVDAASDSVHFRAGENSYTGDATDVYAELPFTSYTTAPVGIVEVAEDTADAGYDARLSLAQEVFGAKMGDVTITLSDVKDGKHALPLGGKTDLASGTSYLSGLRLDAAGISPARKTFYLGMELSSLKGSDVKNGLSGDIAKLFYTVALLDGDDSAADPSRLEGYDGEGIVW